MTRITVTSPSFEDGGTIPARHSKLQGNVSPELMWSGVPDDAAELLLLVEDPDAPSGTWLHWLVTGIDPSAGHVAEAAAPTGGSAWRNDFDENGYGGPQPPEGDKAHRYFFRLYALSGPVELPEQPSADDARSAAEKLALAEGVLLGTFQR